MAGRLTIAPFPAVAIDPHRDGDVNWKLNPFGNPTWGQDFRSGSWIENLVAGYLAGGPQADAYLARARQLAAGWLRALPASGRDPSTLVCIAQAFPGQSWIDDQIPPTVNYYAAHWMGAWNHGLLQDIKLLRIGCGYPPGAFGGDALRWRQAAFAQLVAAFEPNRLGPAIDAQGAVNEQATLYEDFVYHLWQTALPELAACGYRLPGWITARIALLPAFLGYATEPDGDLVQIGDSYVERPATSPRGRRPRRRLRAGGLRVRAVGVDAGRVVLLAAVRARTGDPRPRRPHGPHLLRPRPRPHRRRRALRLYRHAVPCLAAVAGGGEHAGAAGGAVLRRRRHRPWWPTGSAGTGSSTSSTTPPSTATPGTGRCTSASGRI